MNNADSLGSSRATGADKPTASSSNVFRYPLGKQPQTKLSREIVKVTPDLKNVSSRSIIRTPSPPKLNLPLDLDFANTPKQLRSRTENAKRSEPILKNPVSASHPLVNAMQPQFRMPTSNAKPRAMLNNYLKIISATPVSRQINTFQESPSSQRMKQLGQLGIVEKFRELQNSKAYSAVEVEDEEEDENDKSDSMNYSEEEDEENTMVSAGVVKKTQKKAISNKFMQKVDHQKVVNKYKAIISQQTEKESIEMREKLKHSKSESDLNSIDLSNVTGGGSNYGNFQDSIRMYHKHALKKSESQKDLRTSSKLKTVMVKGNEYIVLNLIGTGGSSNVYQVYDPVKQQTLAVKLVDLTKMDESIRLSLKKEIELLQKLRNCKRVVRLIDHEYDDLSGKLILVLEKGDSDLGSILKQFIETDSDVNLDSVVIKYYWKEMLKAVDEIHKNGVVHSDLKPVNFISVGGKLKLIDFGIADSVEQNNTSVIKDAQIGTVNFMPPEALTATKTVTAQNGTKNSNETKKNHFKLSYKSDIWSLGCILYNLIYGRPPFAHLPNMYSKIQAICDTKYPISFPPCKYPHVIDCLKKCLQRKAQDRPSARELLNHPFLNEDKKLSSHIPRQNHGANSVSVNKIIHQMANLTPNRLQQLEKMANQLALKK